MGIFIAQELFLVGREIGNQELAARRHDTGGFRHRRTRIVQVMQHLMEQHDVET